MFKRIVSNLPFSPALVSHLGPYSKMLRSEKLKRRFGLVFMVLALVIQSIAITQPQVDAGMLYNNVTAPDPSQTSGIIQSITASNLSQGFVDATTVTARPADQISYTATVENTNGYPVNYELSVPIADPLEYSALTENGGGYLAKTSNTLTWGNITLAPLSKQTRTFSLRLLDAIPITAKNRSNTKSYDCVMSITFGNTIDLKLDRPLIKIIEDVIYDLPSINVINNFVFSIAIIVIGLLLYERARQQEKELHLIRKDITNGTIL